MLADPHTETAIESPAVIGEAQFQLLVSALAPQGRTITAANDGGQTRRGRTGDTRAAILSLCRELYGPEKGLAAAHPAFTQPE